MGNLMGHVATGLGLLTIGLWHLFNQVKRHVINPNSYTSLPWFPTSRIKYLELYSIMSGCSIFVASELFIGHHFNNISLAFFEYALLSILLDKVSPPAKYGLTNLLGAVAFGQELLLGHLHSTDHEALEGQYHWLSQVIVFASFLSTLLGIEFSGSFLISSVRSVSVLFQGFWIVVMGFMLWTPSLIPKGCFGNFEGGRWMVRCHGDDDLSRAKSLVNVLFSWCVVFMMVFGVGFYLVVFRLYSENIEYRSLPKNNREIKYDNEALEMVKCNVDEI